MIGVDKIGFLEIAILKIRIPEKTGVEGGKIEIAIAEIASEGVNPTEIRMDDDRSGKIAIDHLASGEDAVTTEDVVEAAVLKETEIEKGIDQRHMREIDVAECTPCHI